MWRLCFVVLCLILSAESFLFSQSVKAKNWASKADTLFSQEKFQDASELLSRAIKSTKLRNDQTVTWFYKRSLCYFYLQEYNKALNDLEVVSAQSSKFPSINLIKAFIYKALGDQAQELSHLEKAIDSLSMPSPEINRWYGILLFKNEEFAKAKNILSELAKVRDDAEIEMYIGVCFQQQSQYDSAIISFNKSIGMDAINSQAFIFAGQIFLEKGVYNMAIKYFNLALRIDPTVKEAIFLKGIAFVELKNLDYGCQLLNRAFYSGYDEAADYLKEYCFHIDE